MIHAHMLVYISWVMLARTAGY